jgi:hypothetical protein
MNKKHLKKIIAREGLIILGIIAVGLLVITTVGLYNKPSSITDKQEKNQNFTSLTKEQFQKGREAGYTVEQIADFEKIRKGKSEILEIEKTGKREARIENIGLFILFLGYPAYLLFRFVIWAIRTLRGAK